MGNGQQMLHAPPTGQDRGNTVLPSGNAQNYTAHALMHIYMYTNFSIKQLTAHFEERARYKVFKATIKLICFS